MNPSKDLLLKSLRAVLFGEKLYASDFAEADWKSIFQLADEQTVSALLLDVMSLLPSECITIPLGNKLKRIVTMQRIEQINRLHRKVIVKIDQALKSEGIPVVFMKGQTTALRYPNPFHRTPGDIDFVVNPKDFKKTIDVLEKIGKVDHNLVHEHHGMAWVDGVISHMVNHVYEEGLGLRQVIDYAMFLHRCADKVNWMQHYGYLHEMHMERAWRIFTCICVVYLGMPLPSQVEPFSHQEKVWAEKMMTDIMRVGNFGRGEYVFHHRGLKDAFNNYCWVVKRCWNLGFVCPSEARWWIISKVKRFFWKKSIKK